MTQASRSRRAYCSCQIAAPPGSWGGAVFYATVLPVALISIHNLLLNFGGPTLLDNISLVVEAGERLCLTGRNGAGKSTLLKLIATEIEPERGSLRFDSGVRAEYLPQDLPPDMRGPALDVVRNGRSEELVPTHRAEEVLSRLDIDVAAETATLSGGAKRRVLLARALASGAELLLLDEPTNHLDIDTVLWLEDYLERLTLGGGCSVLFVTHDRAFARRLATSVAEIDRGALIRHDCGYNEFLQRREKRLQDEEEQRALFDKQLAAEEAWLRRGVKARRTRDEGRVKRLLEMREEHMARRAQAGSVRMGIDVAARSGDLVAEVEDLSFRYDAAAPDIIRDFSTFIMRGDRVGIVGPNGVGKTTLIQLLLGKLQPDSGTVKLGSKVQVVYFDQMRAVLDPDRTIYENLGDGYDTVSINGSTRHLTAYLKDFLFGPDEARKPVSMLSGGERNRLLLAKLFAAPSNVLVLDEPSNDLDADTLELLEDLLLDYKGTILLVSHDRDFLDNVVTDCLVLSEGGRVQEYVGGYKDYRAEVAKRQAQSPASAGRDAGVKTGSSNGGNANGAASAAERRRSAKAKTAGPRKLSYRELEALEQLPNQIAQLEEEQATLHRQLADPELYRSDQGGATAASLTARLQDIEDKLVASYARWEELERLAAESPG